MSIAIKLKPAAERKVKQGHPWVFDQGIIKQNKPGNPGSICILFDSKSNRFLAIGLLDPHSPIRIKVLGKSRISINKDWFVQKITTALKLRNPLLATATNSYRLIYGESDGLPGCIVDVYDQVMVVKFYAAIWMPYIDDLLAALQEVAAVQTIVVRLSRILQKQAIYPFKDGAVVYGQLKSETVVFKEHGIRFSANVIKGHKTGYFLDHRANRKKVGLLSKGKSVLDVFAYAGGFSVHALAGGATSVTSLDISKQALELAKQNAALNKFQGDHHILAGDAFDLLQDLIRKGITYDLVVIDPPSFAKKDTEIHKAKVSYKRLAKLGPQLVNKGGTLVMASCSSRVSADDFFELIETEMLSNKVSFELLEHSFHDVDHPIGFKEAAYLKTGYFSIR